jgi:hypothetical protein
MVFIYLFSAYFYCSSVEEWAELVTRREDGGSSRRAVAVGKAAVVMM